jgi:hypothetical protein
MYRIPFLCSCPTQRHPSWTGLSAPFRQLLSVGFSLGVLVFLVFLVFLVCLAHSSSFITPSSASSLISISLPPGHNGGHRVHSDRCMALNQLLKDSSTRCRRTVGKAPSHPIPFNSLAGVELFPSWELHSCRKFLGLWVVMNGYKMPRAANVQQGWAAEKVRQAVEFPTTASAHFHFVPFALIGSWVLLLEGADRRLYTWRVDP